MQIDASAYPLCWPAGWERTPAQRRKLSQFARRSLASARVFVLDELRLLRGQNVVISTNVVLRNDGLPRSGQKAPDDPGVAVYFGLKGKPKALACDRWTRVEDNLWAIGKHIEAIRGQERWGVGTLDQAFLGYDALPAPSTNWWDVLGVERDAGLETIQAAYRVLAHKTHPDTGGSQEEFIRVQSAYEAARSEAARKEGRS